MSETQYCEIRKSRKSEIEDIHFAQWVKKIHKYRQTTRLLVFSDSCLELWKTTVISQSKEFVKTKSFSWFALTSIDVEKKKFKFSFSKDFKPMTVLYDQPTNLLNALGNLFSNIYLPSEYPRIQGEPNFSQNNFAIDPTKSGLTRLKAKLLEKNSETEEIVSLFNTFKNFVYSGMTTFNLGLFENSQYIEYLLDSLSFVPHITSAVFRYSKKSKPHWSEYFYLLQNSKYIECVTTFEDITDDFYNLSQLNQSSFSSSIKTLEFGNSDLSDKEIAVIAQVYRNCNVPNIKFIETTNAMAPFRKNLTSFTNNSHFKSVTLDKIIIISLYTTLKLLKNVEKIGFTSCGLEISEAIQTICGLNGYLNIKSFDFSGNISRYPLPESTLYLPKNLEELKLNNITYTGNSLQVLLAFLAAQKLDNNFSIELNFINLEQLKWESFFKFTDVFSKRKSNITIPKEESPKEFSFRSVYWENNPINESIFSFFERSAVLKTLSFEGCDLSADPKFIPHLRSFIHNTETCTELNISGVHRHSLKNEDLESIIMEFKRDKRSIKRILISHHYYEPSTLDILADTLMMNRVIEYVDFTNNKLVEKKAWIRFFQKLLSRGTPLDFPIPQYEFCEMLVSQEITSDELHNLLVMIKAIQKGNNVNIPSETIQPTNDDNECDANVENEEEEEQNEFDTNTYFSHQLPIRMIDNSVFTSMFDQNYSIDRLLDQI